MNKLTPFYLAVSLLIISACNNRPIVTDIPGTDVPADTNSASFAGKYLSAEVSFSHKVSDRYEIEGHIKNTSSAYIYSDAVLEVRFTDAAKRTVTTKYYTIKKTIKPDKAVSFFIREKVEEPVTGFSVKLFSAVTVKQE